MAASVRTTSPARTNESRSSRNGWFALGLILLVVLCILVYVVRPWRIVMYGTGRSTTNVAKYGEMRASVLQRYPWAPEFLPTSLPTSALVTEFDASTKEFLQASSFLALTITLSESDARTELDRLRAIPSLSSIESEFNFDPDGDTERYATVHYDAATNTFRYFLGSN